MNRSSARAANVADRSARTFGRRFAVSAISAWSSGGTPSAEMSAARNSSIATGKWSRSAVAVANS